MSGPGCGPTTIMAFTLPSHARLAVETVGQWLGMFPSQIRESVLTGWLAHISSGTASPTSGCVHGCGPADDVALSVWGRFYLRNRQLRAVPTGS